MAAHSNFNLRGIPPETMLLLKRQAQEQHISVNLLIIQLIEQGMGLFGKIKKIRHHDLDHLAGTWSETDSKNFEKNTKYFEKIDEDLWK